jgi:pyrroline-5-carboxylate reductase
MTKISFIGAGNMARALVGGLLKAGQDPELITASDPFENARNALAQMGVSTSDSNVASVRDADVIVLAVKPQKLTDVLRDVAASLPPNALLISIVAGMPLSAISAALSLAGDGNRAVVRCMPNTPALLREGITGMYANNTVNDAQKRQAETLAAAAGRWGWVDTEEAIDAVTAVSGSGPAYFFYLMEAMIEAGVELGLSRTLAAELVVATATGAAAMAEQPGADPAVLRQNVTSPGGTTERALALFDEAQLNSGIRTALAGAATRSAELAREYGK